MLLHIALLMILIKSNVGLVRRFMSVPNINHRSLSNTCKLSNSSPCGKPNSSAPKSSPYKDNKPVSKPKPSAATQPRSSPKSSRSAVAGINNPHNKSNNRQQSSSSSSSSSSSDADGGGVRINKCLLSLSRRAADEAVAAGRVTVNGNTITSAGYKLTFGDILCLDGKRQSWETGVKARAVQPALALEERQMIYLKYHKPIGITCTADKADPTNIITAGRFDRLFPQRLFTVGRLDKDSSGLILLTSDGRVNAGLLPKASHKPKVYHVSFDRVASDHQIKQMAAGVVITTPSQHGHGKLVTARTLPCQITRLSNTNLVSITLIEGRNRQIRRMAEAVGLTVISLHRVSFAGIELKGVAAGQWSELSAKEMTVIREALQGSESSVGSKELSLEDEE